MKELKKHLLREFNTISRKNSKQKTSLNANRVMNAVYNTEILFSVLGFQNTSLIEEKSPWTSTNLRFFYAVSLDFMFTVPALSMN